MNELLLCMDFDHLVFLPNGCLNEGLFQCHDRVEKQSAGDKRENRRNTFTTDRQTTDREIEQNTTSCIIPITSLSNASNRASGGSTWQTRRSGIQQSLSAENIN